MKFEKEDGVLVRKVPVCVAYCHDCRERIGPKLASNVGHTLADKHLDHDVESFNWTETEIVECTGCGGHATHVEETSGPYPNTAMVPYCEECGPGN